MWSMSWSSDQPIRTAISAHFFSWALLRVSAPNVLPQVSLTVVCILETLAAYVAGSAVFWRMALRTSAEWVLNHLVLRSFAVNMSVVHVFLTALLNRCLSSG